MGLREYVLNELISKIETVISHLLQAEYDEYANAVSDLVNSMIQNFPIIIAYYYNPLMSEYAEDATYWPGQLERIVNTINSGDELAVCDVLYNETYPNLLELKDILCKKGISL